MNEFELHADRLATTDEAGRRVFLYPADVRGRFRRLRNLVQAFLIVFFLALPWLRIDGRQALLLDIANRRFEILGLSLRAHDVPLLFFVFATAGFTLLFVTTLWGRVWCGWACPQTVFIDGVFRRIERWIEGPALARRTLARAPWKFEKLRKFTAKWLLYLFASGIITHSFLATFVGTEKLAEMIQSSPLENPGSFAFISISTALILFNFAWFREQFCIIVCPYGRFQSVIMDTHSKIVAYDIARGEPRRSREAKVAATPQTFGDCVNCYRCVQVCPTGIDIRRGQQMECIACTSCIDACDDVMTKLKKPTGLIRYSSLAELAGRKTKSVRARPILYFAVVLASTFSFFYTLANLDPVQASILRAKETPFTLTPGAPGETLVLNHFKVELSNQSGMPQEIDFESSESGVELVTAMRPFRLADGAIARVDVFARFQKSLLREGQHKTRVLIRTKAKESVKSLVLEKEATLVGPLI